MQHIFKTIKLTGYQYVRQVQTTCEDEWLICLFVCLHIRHTTL